MVFSACRFIERCNGALEAETLVCVEGIALAFHWTMLPFEVETDWLTLTHMLQSREKDLSASAHLVREIRRLIDGDREISVRKIHHAQNQCHLDFPIRSKDQITEWLCGIQMRIDFGMTFELAVSSNFTAISSHN
ncbi:hypothetical protein OsI_31010 [Oryza sativa Indica Group]|uniref:RNase H type-1 domain-containing protein n=1 Tax=Oryza sativa subsp. indica TaxID=39946 RepID=B8BER0_ORYSI|nr:hypothetical protein OsI_31010 [Oryza sativa Indica Group]